MDRNGVIKRFSELGFPADQCWVQTGAAMVMYGMREHTHDIDMGCSHELAEKIDASGAPYVVMENGRRKFDIGGDVEASEGWAKGKVYIIDGVPCVSPEDIIACKTALGREKDFRDIEIIRRWMESTNNFCCE